MAKLTDLQKKEILAKRAEGEKLQTIADQYGVTKAYISIICKKENVSVNPYLSPEQVEQIQTIQ